MTSKMLMRNITLAAYVLVWAVTQVVGSWKYGTTLDEKSIGMLAGGVTAIVLAFRSDKGSDEKGGDKA